jgi:hypothetical protein
MKKIFFLLFLTLFVFAGCSHNTSSNNNSGNKILSQSELQEIAQNFVQTYLIDPGTQVDLKDFKEDDGFYRFTAVLADREIPSGITMDGKTFFPQVINISEHQEKIDNAPKPEPPKDLEKSDKPKVELFIMSHCPYGVQMEKGILPVLDTLGDKIDFELKFNDYAMHGQKELDEQLRQICIQNEEPDKLNKYLECFLKEGESDNCFKEVGLSSTKITSCVEDLDKQHKVTENFTNNEEFKGRFPSFNVFKDDNAKYGVKGSPTLVLNGTIIKSGRDSQSILNSICSAFSQEPSECDTKLSNVSPSAGFDTGKAKSNNTNAGCGT